MHSRPPLRQSSLWRGSRSARLLQRHDDDHDRDDYYDPYHPHHHRGISANHNHGDLRHNIGRDDDHSSGDAATDDDTSSWRHRPDRPSTADDYDDHGRKRPTWRTVRPSAPP